MFLPLFRFFFFLFFSTCNSTGVCLFIRFLFLPLGINYFLHYLLRYPKLQELICAKEEVMKTTASLPWALQVDLRKYKLQNLMCKFDVIVIDPPWEEYALSLSEKVLCMISDMQPKYRYCRRSSVTAFDAPDVWSYNDVANLDIEAVAANPSFIWIWCGNSQNVSRGRQLLTKWGYRRCEDLVWVKTNKHIRVRHS
jgi:hypothetical protein